MNILQNQITQQRQEHRQLVANRKNNMPQFNQQPIFNQYPAYAQQNQNQNYTVSNINHGNSNEFLQAQKIQQQKYYQNQSCLNNQQIYRQQQQYQVSNGIADTNSNYIQIEDEEDNQQTQEQIRQMRFNNFRQMNLQNKITGQQIDESIDEDDMDDDDEEDLDQINNMNMKKYQFQANRNDYDEMDDENDIDENDEADDDYDKMVQLQRNYNLNQNNQYYNQNLNQARQHMNTYNQNKNFPQNATYMRNQENPNLQQINQAASMQQKRLNYFQNNNLMNRPQQYEQTPQSNQLNQFYQNKVPSYQQELNTRQQIGEDRINQSAFMEQSKNNLTVTPQKNIDLRNQYQRVYNQNQQSSQAEQQGKFIGKIHDFLEEENPAHKERVDSETTTDDDEYISNIEQLKLLESRNNSKRFDKQDFDELIGIKKEDKDNQISQNKFSQNLQWDEEQLFKKSKVSPQFQSQQQQKQVEYHEQANNTQKENKLKHPQEKIFLQETQQQKNIKNEESEMFGTNEKVYLDKNMFNDYIMTEQNDKLNSNNDFRDDDEDDSQDNKNQKKKQKPKCRYFFKYSFIQQRVKLNCYCQENKEDQLVVCDNKKCQIQWFHMQCLTRQYQIMKDLNVSNEEYSLPKDEKEWFCLACLKNKSQIQKRSVKHRKQITKQKNREYYLSIGLEPIIQRRAFQKKEQNISLSNYNLTNSIIGSDNSMSLLKNEFSNQMKDLLNMDSSTVQIQQQQSDVFVNKQCDSGSKDYQNQDKKFTQQNTSQISQNKKINENNLNQQTPHNQRKDVIDLKEFLDKSQQLEKLEDLEIKESQLKKEYLDQKQQNHLGQQQLQEDHFQQKIMQAQEQNQNYVAKKSQISPIQSNNQINSKEVSPNINQLKNSPNIAQEKNSLNIIQEKNSPNINQAKNSPMINQSKTSLNIEETKNSPNYNQTKKEEVTSFSINQQPEITLIQINSQQNIDQKDKEQQQNQNDQQTKIEIKKSISDNNDQELVEVQVKQEQQQQLNIPIQHHQNLIFHCKIKDEFNIKKSKKNITVNSESNIIAYIHQNPLMIELYAYNTEKSQLQSIFSQKIKDQKEFYSIEHIIFKGNTYLVFSHPDYVNIFSVYKTQFQKVELKIERQQQFYLSTNDKSLQIFVKGDKCEELKCYNVNLLETADKSILKPDIDTFYLDEKCQNFSQLCFFKDNNDELNFVFLSQDRMTIYLYPDLVSDKPIRSIEAEHPFKQIQLIDPTSKRLFIMDFKNQILQYEIEDVLEYFDNKCAYQYNFYCIKYYVQPNHNILLQLYEEQIHLSGLDQTFITRPISFAKPFMDAIYLEIEQEIIILYIEKDQNEDKKCLSYYVLHK